ncbi:DUF1127 domain-containing protein [Pseudaestuariivita atlantica]|uniref:DUF1127 domain-containing protein n=1 Tax=Pseudaestuariivita atlantica TaxID=1317121 RepID=A0A0L1JP37_9RHOB|nr:DUF1127 domain-containing protein [Pseudaestuariivita atlantica]KNG93472.1 hypothetical protein ATO11_09585 [Pseudaestuariivita atlantica]
MAYTTADTAAHRSGNPITNALNGIWNWLISISEADHKLRQVEKLQSLSDDQLAKLGLKRQDIVPYVFRDYYYV